MKVGMTKIKTRSKLYGMFGSELEEGGLILVYGEAGTGKTTIAIQLSVIYASRGYKVMYLTTEHPFAAERVADMIGDEIKNVGERIYVIKLRSFKQQLEVIDKLEMFIAPKLRFIVIDTITDNYREIVAEGVDVVKANMTLNRQLATLQYIAKAKEITIMITGQMRGTLENNKDEIVASKVMRHWPDRIVRLERLGEKRVAIIEKSKNKDEVNKRVFFKITDRGIVDEF